GGPGPRGRARGDRAGRAGRTGPARAAAARGARGAVARRRLGVAGLGRDAFLLCGPTGFLHLTPVRLEPGSRLGVLVLPLLTLLLVARQPLAGLRVEALGVLVVALLVVGGRHA